MNIGILGLGLMGGSLARALKRNTEHKVFGFDIQKEAILKALMINAIDKEIEEKDYKDLDVVIICMNVDQAQKAIKDVYKKLKKNAILTDVTGVKKEIIKTLKEVSKDRDDLELITTHPMAGREFSGISHSAIDLYENANILFIPVHNSIKGYIKLKEIFEEIKVRRVLSTTQEEHDKIIAYTSQLPHILSNAYIKNSLALQTSGFTAGSFRDFTRVAKITSSMWIPLFIQNKENLLSSIRDFQENLKVLEKAIEEEDIETLKKVLDEGNDLKILVEKLKNERN